MQTKGSNGSSLTLDRHEWLLSQDPERMLELLPSPVRTRRKGKLLRAGLFRHHWSEIKDSRCRKLVQTQEKAADGRATLEDLSVAVYHAFEAAKENSDNRVAAAVSTWQPELICQPIDQVDTIRDLYGDPFCPVLLDRRVEILRFAGRTRKAKQPGKLEGLIYQPDEWIPFYVFAERWRTSEVISLAHKIYEKRSWELFPFLRDYLTDTGCQVNRVLRHCTTGRVHTRGCWLLDLILDFE